MTTLITTLRDDAARREALTDRAYGLLVEAGAGSGKTAILAGRVALLIADGVPPSEIAAITFTELAAAELATRVREYALDLAKGEVPTTLAVAFPAGAPSAEQRRALQAARDHLDELTCSTIHGFARELVRPYPVEADIDPGARVLDGAEQGLMFDDVFESWLRERLGEKPAHARHADGAAPSRVVTADAGFDVLVQLVTLEGGLKLEDLKKMARLVHEVRPAPATPPPLSPVATRVRALAREFVGAVEGTPGAAEVVGESLGQLRELGEALATVADGPSGALEIVTRERPRPLFTKTGTLAALRVKGDWTKAATAAGLGKKEAEERYAAALATYNEFREHFAQLLTAATDTLLQALIDELAEVGRRYRARKRAAAALDFDDLIGTALKLLRQHPEVRDELAQRYQHVLIDEFQDTDPQQAEIVWRLTGEPIGDDWRTWPTRPGARFVVGDPKQSIYRFRGADARTYRFLTDGLAADPGAKRLELSTNFRSLRGILEAANATFAEPLGAEGQPGYRPLDAFHGANDVATVQRLHVPSTNGVDEKAVIADVREAEAEAVADLVLDLVNGVSGLLGGPVSPGDVALLAPAGTGLDIYERALDARGLSVASQAGKGFYRRQEVQDLVALTRALADPRDRLAFGALLRGPLVGATDEELLDATESLQHLENEARYLSVLTDPSLLQESVVRRALECLRPLAQERFATTPHALLSRALDVLEVRAVLEHRHGAHADRALANVDRFLESSRVYDVRGLTAFAGDVWSSWEDQESELEGRADSEREAVTLITIHSAKGLEWKVVIPVNTASNPHGVNGALFDRERKTIVAKLLGQECSGYAGAKEREEAELHAENVRLWYVAATRARELFVIPQYEVKVGDRAWCQMIEWRPDGTPVIELNGEVRATRAVVAPSDVAQSREQFAAEQLVIEQGLRRIERKAPSRRDEPTPEALAAGDAAEPKQEVAPLTASAVTGLLAALDEEDPGPNQAPTALTVGAARGILLHKLLEEIVNGESLPELVPLAERAAALAAQLHLDDGQVDPREVAETSLRAWNLPEVAALHGRLLAEVDVAGFEGAEDEAGVSIVWGGIADAIAVDSEGRPEVVIDWKSDRNPSEEMLKHYREQVRGYLRLTSASRGMLVLATAGEVLTVFAE